VTGRRDRARDCRRHRGRGPGGGDGRAGRAHGVFPALAFAGIVSVVSASSLLLIVTAELRGLADVCARAALALDGRRALGLIILAITGVSAIGAPTETSAQAGGAIDRFGWFGLDRIGIVAVARRHSSARHRRGADAGQSG
jgi:hypothetical protein